MGATLVVHLDPGLGGLVEQREGQILDAFEHRQQPALELGPKDFLLGILVGRVRQRRAMEDAQAMQARERLGRRHGPTVVGHEGPWHGALLQRLPE